MYAGLHPSLSGASGFGTMLRPLPLPQGFSGLSNMAKILPHTEVQDNADLTPSTADQCLCP